jgi:hypothetical protein
MAKAQKQSFAVAIAKHAKSARKDDLARAVGDIVKARLRKPKPQAPKTYTPVPLPKPRKSPRRLGKFRSYTPTAKPDYSRPGTFRTYMISTIRAHTNTRAANEAHALCTEPAFAKNKLDFNWAADNGYITFD